MAVLGISLDSVAENRAFAEKYSYPFPLLSDEDGQVALAYGAIGSSSDQFAARYTFVIGPNGRIEQSIDTQNPGGQAEELLASL